MERRSILAGLGAAMALPSLAGAAEPLKVGDMVPDFSLPGTDGKDYSLKQFLGKSVLVIAWYPKALTGG